MEGYLKLSISLLCLILAISLFSGEIFSLDNSSFLETRFLKIQYTYNADNTVNCSIKHEFQYTGVELPKNSSILVVENIDISLSEEIEESSIEVMDLYDASLKFNRVGNLQPEDGGKYSFDPNTNRIKVYAPFESEIGGIQVKYTVKPLPTNNDPYNCKEQGEFCRAINFTMPFSSSPYKFIIKGVAGEGLRLNLSTNFCPGGWKEIRTQYPSGFECINDSISFVNESQIVSFYRVISGSFEPIQDLQNHNEPSTQTKNQQFSIDVLSNHINSPIGWFSGIILAAVLGVILTRKYGNKTPDIKEVAESIDSEGYKLMQQHGRLPRGADHFSLEGAPTEVINSAQRLIDLGILWLKTESHEKGHEHAYRWTDLGYKVIEQLDIKKMTMEEFEKTPAYEVYKSDCENYEELKKKMKG